MLKLLVGASCLAAAECLKLDFTRSTTVDLSPRYPHEIQSTLYNDFPHQRYLINITVGNPPQLFAVTLDTGSGDLWVPSPNSTGCAPNCPPTFDPSKSKTYRDTGYIFNVTYGLGQGQSIIGPYFNDTLGLGNVPPAMFVDGLFGIMGLGSPRQEALSSNPKLVAENKTFPMFYDLLHDYGYISKRVFSIWLDDQSASTGSILFGGIDQSKYRSPLLYVPVVEPGPNFFSDWRVNVSSIVVHDKESNKTFNATNATLPGILDSGSPNIYLPPDLANAVTAGMNITTYQGFPYVSCDLRQSKSSVEFRFDHGHTRGPRINVPYGEIIYPYGDPANIGPVHGSDGSKLCYLGLIGAEVPFGLIGDPFIRSAYVVYDAEDLQVGLAQACYS